MPDAAEAVIRTTPTVWGGRAMSMKKKAKGKSKGTAKKTAKKKASAKKRAPSKKKGKDIVQVRQNISELVKDSAKDIATEVIKVAKTGQLASAKYLFEAAGIYPATEQVAVNPIERSLAHTLLTRMGLPLEPVVVDEEPNLAVLAGDAKSKSTEANVPAEAEENPEGEPAGEPAAAESKEQEPSQ
ncbi:MAG: hypothetical protein WBW46_18045 [Candidatus Sulfotelmatobacter sp.]